MGKYYGKVEVKVKKPRKKRDEHNRVRHMNQNFHVTVHERDLINARIAVTGMKKRAFFIQSCLYQKILVKGNVRSFSTIKATLRDLTEKIDKNPNLENLDPMDAERLLTILQIMDNIYGRNP